MKVITIGRNKENNDIIINDALVSRNHLQIIKDDEGTFFVIDLDSTNGTFVNGKPISGKVSLSRGDELKIGNTILPWQNYFPTSNEGDDTPTKKPLKKIWFWVIVIGIIMLLGGGITYLVAFFNYDKTPKEAVLQDSTEIKYTVAQKEYAEAKAEYAEAQAEYAEAQKEVAEAEKEAERLAKIAAEKGTKEAKADAEKARNKASDLQSNLTKTKNRLTEITKQIKTKETEIKELEKKIKEKDTKISQQQQQIEQNNNTIKERNETIKQKESENQKLKEENDRLKLENKFYTILSNWKSGKNSKQKANQFCTGTLGLKMRNNDPYSMMEQHFKSLTSNKERSEMIKKMDEFHYSGDKDKKDSAPETKVDDKTIIEPSQSPKESDNL